MTAPTPFDPGSALVALGRIERMAESLVNVPEASAKACAIVELAGLAVRSLNGEKPGEAFVARRRVGGA